MQVKLEGRIFWLNCHHLYYFYVVVNEGSLSKASKYLSVGQSSLSSQIKLFEQSLGISLFDRTSKKLVLTEAGKMAHTYATEIFRTCEEMVRKLDSTHTYQAEQLKIGVQNSIAYEMALKVIKNGMHQTECPISLSEEKFEDLIEQVREGALDMVICDSYPSKSDLNSAIVQKVFRTPVSVYGPPKFENLKHDFPNTLHEAPFMLPPSFSPLRGQIDDWFSRKGIKVKSIGEASDMNMKKLMAREGYCLYCAPLLKGGDLGISEEIVEIGHLEGVYVDIFVIFSEKFISSSVGQSIVTSLK